MHGMTGGTIIQMKDGRVGTVVYNSLDGIGVNWGKHRIPQQVFDLLVKYAGLFPCEDQQELSVLKGWQPDAMLRELYPGATIPCIGCDYEILESDPPELGEE